MKSVTSDIHHDHAWATELLPWLVNGTLAEGDAQRVRAHLTDCAECSRDYAFERRIARHIAVGPVVDYAPQASFARVRERIERNASRKSWWRRPRARGNEARRRSPFAVAVVAQAAALAALALAFSWFMLRPSMTPDYRTLSSEPAPEFAGGYLQVVFADEVTAADIRATLARVRGRIVSGPSQGGVFLVVIETPEHDANELEAAARTLEAQRGVRFVAVQRAEPVTQ